MYNHVQLFVILFNIDIIHIHMSNYTFEVLIIIIFVNYHYACVYVYSFISHSLQPFLSLLNSLCPHRLPYN